MKLEVIKCARGILQRLKEPRVFQFKLKYNIQPTLQVTLTRWATLLLYGWLAALVVYLFLPLIILIRPSNLLSLNGHLGWYWALLLTHVLISVMVVLYLQAKLYIRLPRRTFTCGYCFDIQSFLRYPSLHLAVIFGVVFLFWLSGAGLDALHANSGNVFIVAIEKATLLFSQESAARHSTPAVSAFGLFLFLIIYGLFSVVRNEMTLRKENEKTNGSDQKTPLDLLTCSDPQFIKWFSTEKDEIILDFFDRRPYVNRIFNRLVSEEYRNKGQVLLGEFGSGKTTIVNMVKNQLDESWIKSEFDCWQRAGKPEELATQFMEQIIHDVGQQIDASSLASLPDSFAHALYGVSNWFSFLDPLLRPDTSAEVVEKLDRLLEANNRKLLIVVENVDRNKERDHFIDVISAILDKLSSNKNIRFIFSGDESYLNTEMVYRISDYKENLDNFAPVEIVLRFIAMCLKKSLRDKSNGDLIIYPYIKKGFSVPLSTEVQILEMGEIFNLGDLIRNSKEDEYEDISSQYLVLRSLVDILNNPRLLKYVLRDTYDLWASNECNISGEVNLFDFIAYLVSKYDGKLKEIIKTYAEEISSSDDNNPFTWRIRRNWKQNDRKLNKSDIPAPEARDFIAYYLLNGDVTPGVSIRYLCQPIIVVNGISENKFSKYRKIVDIGMVEGYADSDQEFLRNYIKASGVVLNTEAIKSALTFGQNHQVIFESLVKAMTCNYFESVKELHQFAYNAIVLADFKYALMSIGIFHSIFSLCFTVMNFDRKGGDDHAIAFENSLKFAFTELDRKKQYSFLMRMLWFLVVYGKENHFSSIVKNIVEGFITQSLAVRMGLNFRNNHPGTYELQYEFINFLPEIVSASHIFDKDDKDDKKVIKQAARTFLIIVGMRFKNDPNIIVKFNTKYASKLADLKQIIEKELGTDINEGIELDVWKEIQRVVPASDSETDSKAEE